MIMKKSFFSNLCRAITNTEECKSRVKINWIYPACLGLPNNPLDEHNRNDLSYQDKRKYFCDLIIKIHEYTHLGPIQILSAFLGSKHSEYNEVKKSL